MTFFLWIANSAICSGVGEVLPFEIAFDVRRVCIGKELSVSSDLCASTLKMVFIKTFRTIFNTAAF